MGVNDNAQAAVTGDENRDDATTVKAVENTVEKEEDKVQVTSVGLSRFEWVYVISSLVCQFTVLMATLSGITYMFTDIVNPVYAINSVINLFSIRKGNVYVTLACVAASVFYVILLIYVIKNTVQAIKLAIKVTKKSETKVGSEFYSLRWNNIYGLYGLARESAVGSVKYMALCYMLSGSALSVGSYFVIAVFLINYTLGATLLFIQRNKSSFRSKEVAEKFAFSLFRTAVFVTVACLAASFYLQPSVREVAFGLRALFTGIGWSVGLVQALYDLIAKHILDFVLAVLFMQMLTTLFYDPGFFTTLRSKTDGKIKLISRKMMIIAGVSAGLYCAFVAVGGIVTKFEIALIGNLFYTLKLQYLPAILFAGALFALALMPYEKKGGPLSATKT